MNHVSVGFKKLYYIYKGYKLRNKMKKVGYTLAEVNQVMRRMKMNRDERKKYWAEVLRTIKRFT